MSLIDIAQLDSNSGAVFGALPFQTLGMNVSDAADCWGNKFTYAVTKDLNDSVKFLDPNTEGALMIKTSPTNLFLKGAGYVVISHGVDGLGAVKNNYSDTSPTPDKKWCATSADLRTENCDIDDPDIISAEYNNGKDTAGKYFDDIIIYRGKPWSFIAPSLNACNNIAGTQTAIPPGTAAYCLAPLMECSVPAAPCPVLPFTGHSLFLAYLTEHTTLPHTTYHPRPCRFLRIVA